MQPSQTRLLSLSDTYREIEEQFFNFVFNYPSNAERMLEAVGLDHFSDNLCNKLYLLIMEYKAEYNLSHSDRVNINLTNFFASKQGQVLTPSEKDTIREIICNQYLATDYSVCLTQLEKFKIERDILKLSRLLEKLATQPLKEQEKIEIVRTELDKIVLVDKEKRETTEDSAKRFREHLFHIPDVFCEPFLPALQKALPYYTVGQLSVVAGASNMGKSQFLINQASYSAYLQGLPIIYVTPEMNETQLMSRLYSMISFQKELYGVPNHLLQIPQSIFLENEAYKLKYGHPLMCDQHLATMDWIDENIIKGKTFYPKYCENGQAYPSEIRYWIKDVKRITGKTPVVLIDYYQKLDLPAQQIGQHSMSITLIKEDYQRFNEIAKQLAHIAKSEHCPIILGSQITNKALEYKGNRNKRPSIDHIKGTSNLADEAANVLTLYREEYYLRDKCPEDSKGVIEIGLVKARDGAWATIKGKERFDYSSICPLEEETIVDSLPSDF